MLVGRDDEDAVEAAVLAGAVGLRNLAGYLAGGMTSWREEKLAVERVERMTVPELHERWEADGDGLQVLDVREQSEWDAGHIPGSVHEPYHDIRRRPGRHRPGPAGRGHLRFRPALGGRREPAAALRRPAGHPRRRGRRAAVAARGLADRAARAGTAAGVLLAIPFGLAIGLAVGTLGGGGSVLAVPVLVYVLDQTVPEATTASLLVVAAGAVAGGLSHARAGRVCWRHAGSFTAAAIPGIAARHARRRGCRAARCCSPASPW